MTVKIHALAGWLVPLIEPDRREQAREKVTREGVYSAIQGRWWLRITRTRGTYFGQLDALGTGRALHMMEDILHLRIPQATMESHRLRIAEGALRLPMLLDAPGVPDLEVTECLFNRVAQYRLKSTFLRMTEDEIWSLPAHDGEE